MPAPGEIWAYRTGGRETPVLVEIVRAGTHKPPRTWIRFVDDQFEGREDWVPTGRLKTLWRNVEDWLASEAQWDALRAASRHVRDTAPSRAVDLVLEHCPAGRFAEQGCNRDAGLLRIRDLAGLAAAVDLDLKVITEDPPPLSQPNGMSVVPWRTTERVARAAARRYSEEILDQLESQEVRARRDATYGRTFGMRGNRDGGYLDPEACAEADRPFQAAREVVRVWCGAEATDRRRELIALRAEVRRLGDLVEQAADQLRRTGLTRQAAALERHLGVPVATIRQAPAPPS